MAVIVIVDDHASFVAKTKATLREEFGEKEEPRHFHLISEAQAAFRTHGFFDKVDLALVDLELEHRGKDDRAEDYSGRDVILKDIREYAPWLPVVLVSHYVATDPVALARVSAADFDGILWKKFFSDPAITRSEWEEFRGRVALRRNSSQIGVSPSVLGKWRDGDRVTCTEPVKRELGRRKWASVGPVIQLMGLARHHATVDMIVQGFSDVVVLRVSSDIGSRGAERTSRWLVKIGEAIGKLTREASAHRQMFLEGATRRIVVPMVWPSPVVVSGLGGIAYEYEDNASTLLEHMQAGVGEPAAKDLGNALGEVYRGAHEGTVILRDVLSRLMSEATKAEVMGTGQLQGSKIQGMYAGIWPEATEASCRLHVAAQHGDLHARNVLVAKDRCTLIDWSQYVSVENQGVPALDIAKLLCDIAIFSPRSVKLRDVVTGDAVDNGWASILLERLASVGMGLSEADKVAIGTAAEVIAANYLRYPDVPSEMKKEIRELLAGR